ncbi:MAG: ABC transporter ATP-binding protein [Gemmatimonadetes bacterium]|nr:ABC transporter ATP-binding protein [Gemmatimonadota bacterium]
MSSEPILKIEGLRTTFHTEEETVRAVRDVGLEIREGHTLGLVGESGSGKSVTSLSILRLLPEKVAVIEGGQIRFLGRDLVKMPEKELIDVRGAQISMIFQEPMTSLNPVLTVGAQVMEAILIHQDVKKKEARERTIQLFDEVGLPDPAGRVDMYPHELSGGQQQRVMIAMALSCNPKLLIADEPTTALDVTIQAQILDLLRNLRDTRQMSILFITHDLGVISEIADDVAVMFRGEIVEYGPVLDIFENPKHPYTKGLLACRPRLETDLVRLPSVSDFLEISKDGDGELRIVERETDMERFRAPRPAPTPHEGRGADLQVEDLKVHFPIRKGILQRTVGWVKAVDGISFHVTTGRTLGLVGESGCGKTTTGRAILRLIEPTAGTVRFNGEDLSTFKGRRMRELRKEMQIVFQDPYGSLNPRMTVEGALIEPMEIHGIGSGRKDRRDRAAALLDEVGLGSQHLRRYPHEFSGGQRQRICIARALTVDPTFLICDESVSALDVSVQAQVLNLFKDLQERRHLTYIFISHDLAVVKFMSDELAIMNDGKIVEMGDSDGIYANPREDYTKRLIDAIPDDRLDRIRERVAARG